MNTSFKIRTQMNDVERAYISVVLHEEDNYEMIYELEGIRIRQTDLIILKE